MTDAAIQGRNNDNNNDDSTTTTITTTSTTGTTTNNTTINNCNTLDVIKIYCNLQCVNGVRCIVCFLVVFFHVQFLWKAILPRESTCSNTVSNLGSSTGRYNFLGTFLFDRITFHMTLFWIISGFLCEYQLHQIILKKNKQQQKNQKQQHDHSLSTNTNTVTTSISCTTITWNECIQFLYNRLLRLYPLYIIAPIMAYILLNYNTKPMPVVNSQLSRQELLSYPLSDFILTLLFSKQWTSEQRILPAVSWSVQVDVHGYIFLLFLFLVSYKNVYCPVQQQHQRHEQQQLATFPLSLVARGFMPYKRILLLLLYIGSIVSVIYNYKPLPFQNPKIAKEIFTSLREYGSIGIETTTEQSLFLHGYGGTVGRTKMYPYINFNDTSVQQLMKHVYLIAEKTYFASIFNHGSAVFLGSLLYINCYKRYTNIHYYQHTINNISSDSTNFWCIMKLLLAYILLLVTRGWYTTSGISMYFFLDSILSMKKICATKTETISPHNSTITSIDNSTDKSSAANLDTSNTSGGSSSTIRLVQEAMLYPVCNSMCYCIVSFLSSPIFTLLAPYTYSIYLFHMIFIGSRHNAVTKFRVDAIINGARNMSSTTNTMDLACQSLKDAGYPYTIQFVVYETIVSFIYTLILSIIYHYTWEKPITKYFGTKTSKIESNNSESKKLN